MCYIQHYLEIIAQYVDSGVAGCIGCGTVNFTWKFLHVPRQWYCRLNLVCYIEHYVEVIAQYLDRGVPIRMERVTVNFT